MNYVGFAEMFEGPFSDTCVSDPWSYQAYSHTSGEDLYWGEFKVQNEGISNILFHIERIRASIWNSPFNPSLAEWSKYMLKGLVSTYIVFTNAFVAFWRRKNNPEATATMLELLMVVTIASRCTFAKTYPQMATLYDVFYNILPMPRWPIKFGVWP